MQDTLEETQPFTQYILRFSATKKTYRLVRNVFQAKIRHRHENYCRYESHMFSHYRPLNTAHLSTKEIDEGRVLGIPVQGSATVHLDSPRRFHFSRVCFFGDVEKDETEILSLLTDHLNRSLDTLRANTRQEINDAQRLVDFNTARLSDLDDQSALLNRMSSTEPKRSPAHDLP